MIKRIKKGIQKYGLNQSFILIIKYSISYNILFLKKIKNSFIELIYKDYFIIKHSVAPPLFKNNWGDYINIVLMELIAPNSCFLKASESWNLKQKNEYLCVGSIISWMTTNSSIIWGSGVVYPKQTLLNKPVQVLAVRGPLTRQYLIDNGVDCPSVYGDPALLFPRYYKPLCEKKYKFGLIPHFRDKTNPIVDKLVSQSDVLFIDVQDISDWRLFIDKINMCECILSSSLHGIIISDAYCVPNVWIEFIDGEQKHFAFQDYFLSVKKEISKPIIIEKNIKLECFSDYISEWNPPQIDIEKLLSVCPFIKK